MTLLKEDTVRAGKVIRRVAAEKIIDAKRMFPKFG